MFLLNRLFNLLIKVCKILRNSSLPKHLNLNFKVLFQKVLNSTSYRLLVLKDHSVQLLKDFVTLKERFIPMDFN